MLLDYEKDLECTATPTDDDAVESIIATIVENDSGGGPEDVEKLQEISTEMEKVGSVVALLSTVARVKRYIISSGEPQHSLITQLEALQKDLRSQRH